MSELYFTVKAGLKNIIGKDLITDDNIAIFELVKNSYDAHANNVVITFEENKITIADDGKGMSYNDLLNKWLAVAYSAKQDGTEDIDEDEQIEPEEKRTSYRDGIQNRRFYAGAKGIGRFSCDRLGSKLVLTTRRRTAESSEQLEIDWTKFDNNYTGEFERVPVTHSNIEEYSVPYPNDSQHGTILEIENAHSWDRNAIKSLKHSLEKLINPFSETDDFSITIVSERDLDEDKNEPIERNKINGKVKNSILDILNIKTTQIEVVANEHKITSKLYDRGTLIYHIEEHNKYNPHIDNLKIDLYFLNRSAKVNFGKKVGITPVNYGSVFLFKNGFRIQPYGNPGDDSWGLDYRAQQGHNRYLGSRSLFGRVDVITDDVEQFNEVSSRDGGLKKTKGYQQLQDAFKELALKRLERYVVGVLWGEAFLRNNYFKSDNEALNFRTSLQEKDQDSDDFSTAKSNIGSKIDFIRLIKSLADDKDVRIIDYNRELVDIVNENLESVDEKFIVDLKKIADATDDETLWSNIEQTERAFQDLRIAKEEAERIAEEAEARRREAEHRASDEERKRVIAEERAEQEGVRRVKAEQERDTEKSKNKYLASTRHITPEVEGIIHTIKLSSTEMESSSRSIAKLSKDIPVGHKILHEIGYLQFHVKRISKLAKLLTKADITALKEHTVVDIPVYIKEYLPAYSSSLKIEIDSEWANSFERKIPLLDLSVILDNIVSNAKKADATKLHVTFMQEGRNLFVDFSDNGSGVEATMANNDSLFELGITNRKGGSGIGLYTIKDTMQKELHGNIEFIGNGLHFDSGATFRLIF